MSPLTAALLAGRTRLGPRALASLPTAASARGGEVVSRGARSAATDAGPPRRGAPTSEDEEHKWDSYGAMPASPGGQPQPPSKEALHQHAVEQAETQSPLESERTEPGVHVHAGSPLPGGVEGVEVTNALPGRPRGAGAPFEQRRGP